MSQNAKVVALLLLLLLLFGVAGEMDYQEALRSEHRFPSVDRLLPWSAHPASEPVREPLIADEAAANDCSNVGNLKTNDVPAACDLSRLGR